MVDLTTPPPAPVNESRANALRQLYETAPLYRKYTYTAGGIGTVVKVIKLYCPVCRHDQPYQSINDHGHSFRCRACQKSEVVFYVYFGESEGKNWMMKVGQYPPIAERIPSELETRLSGPDLELYRKALRSRTFSFGIGALAYLRRVVENRTNELLDLIAETASQLGSAPDLVQRIADAKRNFQFDQKVALAAEILPSSLTPGGMNPLDALHDLASAGLHRMSEEDCLDQFDKAKTAFEYLFRQLQVDRDAALEYVEAMHKLQQARAEVTKPEPAKAESAEVQLSQSDAPSLPE